MRQSRSLVLAAALVLGACATMMGGADDMARTEDLRAQLHSDANLMYVTAQVRANSAYLGGWAPNYAARYKAEAIAGKIPGVTKVYDSMGTGSNDRGNPRG